MNKWKGIIALVFDALFEEYKKSNDHKLSEIFTTLITFLKNLIKREMSFFNEHFKAEAQSVSLFKEYVYFHENAVLTFLEPLIDNEISLEEICSSADISLRLMWSNLYEFTNSKDPFVVWLQSFID